MKYLKPAILILVLTSAIAGGWYQWQQSREQARAQASAELERGISLFRQKQHAEALEVLEDLSVDDLPDWRLPYHRGSLLIILKQFDRAVPDLEVALSLAPAASEVMFALGVAHYKLGQLSIARAYFAQVLEVDPDNADARGLMDIMAKLERQSSNTP